ncbi:MAG: hypothetical protein ACYC77_07725 [Coriobacteriia bacterium]
MSDTARASTNGRLIVPIAAVVLVVLAILRAMSGISFVDDSHYAAITLRLANGAQPFADEMTMQSLGFVLAAPFAWVWEACCGVNGLVLALRLYYVALATGVGAIAYRALNPSFGEVASFAAIAAPLLAVPYNILGLTYNTGALLGFVLATALGLAALRDRSTSAALGAGVALAIGALSYPPLAIAAIAFVVTFVLLARDRTLAVRFLLGCAIVAVPAVIWLLAIGTDAIARSIEYSRAVWATLAPADARIDRVLWKLGDSVGQKLFAPLWVLALVALVPRVPARWRSYAAVLVPLAAAAPGLRYLAMKRGYTDWFGYTGAAILTLVTVAGLFAVVALARRSRNADLTRLLVLAAPLSLIAYALVATSTTTAWVYAAPIVGLAPLAAAVVAGLVLMAEESGEVPRYAAAAGLIGVLLLSLFATSFKDDAPLALDTRVDSGAFAGIRTTAKRADDIAVIEDVGLRYVATRDTRVLVIAHPAAYLLVGGRMHTNAVWLAVGSPDSYTVEYFERSGTAPDVVLIARSLLATNGGLASAAIDDPLLRYVADGYDLAEDADPLLVYVPR